MKIKKSFLAYRMPLLDHLLQREHEPQGGHANGSRTMSSGLNSRQSGSMMTMTSAWGLAFCSQWMMLMGLLYGRYESLDCPQREAGGWRRGWWRLQGNAPCPKPAKCEFSLCP